LKTNHELVISFSFLVLATFTLWGSLSPNLRKKVMSTKLISSKTQATQWH
jgi:hypothetical protein